MHLLLDSCYSFISVAMIKPFDSGVTTYKRLWVIWLLVPAHYRSLMEMKADIWEWIECKIMENASSWLQQAHLALSYNPGLSF